MAQSTKFSGIRIIKRERPIPAVLSRTHSPMWYLPSSDDLTGVTVASCTSSPDLYFILKVSSTLVYLIDKVIDTSVSCHLRRLSRSGLMPVFLTGTVFGHWSNAGYADHKDAVELDLHAYRIAAGHKVSV